MADPADGNAVWAASARLVALARPDEATVVFDAATGQQRYSLAGCGHRPGAVGFSPDGDLLATAGSDWRVHMWDMATGERILMRDVHRAVSALAFADRGRLLTGHTDGAIRFWEIPTGRQAAELLGLLGPVCQLACSSDGQHAVAVADPDQGSQAVTIDVGRLEPLSMLADPPRSWHQVSFGLGGLVEAFDRHTKPAGLRALRAGLGAGGHRARRHGVTRSPASRCTGSARLTCRMTGRQFD